MKVIAKLNMTASVAEDGQMNVNGMAVVDGSEENKAFSEFTPCANFSMVIAKDKEAQKAFTPGVSKEYYVTIEEVPAKEEESKEYETKTEA